jgi:hypothetical protein
MDQNPDLGSPKTYGSDGSRSETLITGYGLPVVWTLWLGTGRVFAVLPLLPPGRSAAQHFPPFFSPPNSLHPPHQLALFLPTIFIELHIFDGFLYPDLRFGGLGRSGKTATALRMRFRVQVRMSLFFFSLLSEDQLDTSVSDPDPRGQK